jgi:hypothetical protein
MGENIYWIDFDTMERFMVDVFKGVVFLRRMQ